MIKQFDIKTAFLYGELDEKIFLKPAPGYGNPGDVWKLKRSLCGLKQSPRFWNKRFLEFMTLTGLQTCQYDRSLFFDQDRRLFVLVYVDDGLIIGKNIDEIDQILTKLKDEFEMRELKHLDRD